MVDWWDIDGGSRTIDGADWMKKRLKTDKKCEKYKMNNDN
jgi:hypothetical protein